MLDLYLKLLALVKKEEGQDLVEYALLVALIALACIIAVTAGGTAIQNVWTAISNALAASIPA